jgi:hypothetical protein
MPRLVELEQAYRDRGVKFVAVYSNQSETLNEIAAHAEDRNVPFLILKDFNQQLADTLGIDRTPLVAVLDGDLVLRYRGRIDDQYAVASRKQEPTSSDLALALDAMIAGRTIDEPETIGDGCLLERDSAFPRFEGLTYSRDIAPILQNRCQDCHRPGQIGPFSMLEYGDVARHRTKIKEVVEQRRMPPWHADPRYGEFRNDRRMPDEEIAALISWIDSGAPQGDPSDLPEAIEWPVGFRMQNPDVVIPIPELIEVPADGVVDYLYPISDPGFTEDMWVVEGEILPGNPEVLHHALISVLTPTGEVDPDTGRPVRMESKTLVNWVPGQRNKLEPEGAALKVPKGSLLRWQLHYTPNGVATTDRTSVALRFSDVPPMRETQYDLFADFRINVMANTSHHLEDHVFTFKRDGHLVSARPHMHVRGKSWRYEVKYPNGETTTLLSVPNWDFNWQTEYYFKEPMPMPAGTEIHAFAHWDNSDNNIANPDRSLDVRYGRQTWDEMMNGWLKFYYDDPVKVGGGR